MSAQGVRRFDPIETDRLRLRALAPDDAPALAAYRSDPAVARDQSWSVPYSVESARRLIADVGKHAGPTVDEWYQIGIEALPAGALGSDGLLGDVAVHLEDGGRQAEIGYTIGRPHQRRGVGSEAIAALLDHLFHDLAVHRVFAYCLARNVASARLLERLGFRLEGRGRKADWCDGEWLDDCEYALLGEEWHGRPSPPAPPNVVALVEITAANVHAARALAVAPSQERFVASVVTTLADAAVPAIDGGHPLRPWYRLVTADEEVVGFVMLALPRRHDPRWFLWRLLVDARHQGRGVGRGAVALVAHHVRTSGGHELFTSWVPGDGSPEGFYRRLGFAPTGEVDDGEVVAVLPVAAP
jgi:RimJ/RimL family protein N-acetyltransferase